VLDGVISRRDVLEIGYRARLVRRPYELRDRSVGLSPIFIGRGRRGRGRVALFFVCLPIWRIDVSSKASFKARVAKSRDGVIGVEDDEAGVEGSDVRGWRGAGEYGLGTGASSPG
jgi:hypothetical protein